MTACLPKPTLATQYATCNLNVNNNSFEDLDLGLAISDINDLNLLQLITRSPNIFAAMPA